MVEEAIKRKEEKTDGSEKKVRRKRIRSRRRKRKKYRTDGYQKRKKNLWMRRMR